MALLAVVLGLLAQYAAGLFVDAAAVIGRTPGVKIPWGDLARQPAYVWLGFHGGVTGVPITVTGICWIALSLVFARKIVFQYFPISRRPAVDSTARLEVLAYAVKTALVYMGAAVVVSVVVNATRDKNPQEFFGTFGTLLPGFFPAGIGFEGQTNLAASIFIAFIVAALVGFFIFARAVGGSVYDAVGLPVRFRLPARFGAIWAGARRTLLVGGAGMLAFFYVAVVLDIGTSHTGLSGKELAAEALLLVPTMILWSGVDVGLTAFIVSMRFFLGEHRVVPSGKPGWVFAAMIITAVAFLLGGMAAARKSTHADGRSAITTAAATAPIVAVVLFMFALFHASTHGSGGVIASGLFLPLLWASVAAIGGLVYANQNGLPVALTVTFPNRTPPAPGGAAATGYGQPPAGRLRPASARGLRAASARGLRAASARGLRAASGGRLRAASGGRLRAASVRGLRAASVRGLRAASVGGLRPASGERLRPASF